MTNINYRLAAECATLKRLITEVYPSGICSLVYDSYDFWGVLTVVAPKLYNEIMAREPICDGDGNILVPGKTVFRPDSGDPVRIICGYITLPHRTFNQKEDVLEFLNDWPQRGYEHDAFYLEDGTYYCPEEDKVLTEAEVKGSVQVLWDIFGGTETDKGYKMLNEKVGLIYGDSITLPRAQAILKLLKDKGFASTNVVFGIGSYTYQYNTRDTFGWAMKATDGIVNGKGREISKDPATDSGTKKSAKGILVVEKQDKDYVLLQQQDVSNLVDETGELVTVFKDGSLVVDQTFEQVRSRLVSER